MVAKNDTDYLIELFDELLDNKKTDKKKAELEKRIVQLITKNSDTEKTLEELLKNGVKND